MEVETYFGWALMAEVQDSQTTVTEPSDRVDILLW